MKYSQKKDNHYPRIVIDITENNEKQYNRKFQDGM